MISTSQEFIMTSLPHLENEEERMRRILRRALTSGRIDELPDNVELGDIRKAFSKRLSLDDDHDGPHDVTVEDFLVPDSGRPLSRKNSVPRRHRGDYVIDDDDVTYEEVHYDSCDCSECEEEIETRRRFHDGELRKKRETKRNDVVEERKEVGENSRMNQMRQRYLESLVRKIGFCGGLQIRLNPIWRVRVISDMQRVRRPPDDMREVMHLVAIWYRCS